VTDALSQTATRRYHLDGNLAEIDYDSADTPDEAFTYDDHYNRLETLVDGLGTHAYHYHPNDGTTHGAGLVARIDGPFADDTLKYAYDALARLKKRQIVDDATHSTASYSEEYVFDAQSRVEDIINDLGTFDYSYVGQSERIDAVDYPNGMRTQYTYEDATGDHLIQQIKHLDASATPAVISQFDYTYRQDRNIYTWTTQQNGDPAKKWTFGYDDALRLTGAVRTDTTTQGVLQDYGFRYYDAETGRWPNRDPIFELGKQSYFRYQAKVQEVQDQFQTVAARVWAEVMSVSNSQKREAYRRAYYKTVGNRRHRLSEMSKGYIGVALQCYAFIRNAPTLFIDLLGLTLEVYSTPAWGNENLNHTYVHSTETGRSRGRSGSSGSGGEEGSGAPEGGPAPGDELVGEVTLPEGVTEDEFMDELNETAEDGLYCPWLNDCHTSIERAAENCGGAFEPNDSYGGRIGD